ncbi:MAG: AAA family ATPase [Gammaproteobacteria bacterium]
MTFLREVHLNDFRTFGEFRLPLPPGPGLTLLVGTNGLGKSSFFDGIEWCLTGGISRFKAYVGKLEESDYLTRRDAEPGAHRVSLTFSEGEPLVRTFHKRPSSDTLLGLLKDPRWTEIKDIGAYLGFTHFLGQASQQRFTSRAQSDQWQALKGPSGIDRLESIRVALRGRMTTNAFKRRADREQEVVINGMRALEEWQANIVRLRELQLRSAAAGAETEATLDARLLTLESALAVEKSTAKVFTTRLSLVRAAIETEQRRVAHDRAGLVGLYAILERFSETSALTDPESNRLTAAQAIVTSATTQLSEMMLAGSRSEQAAATQSEVLVRAETEQTELIRVRAAIAELAVLEAEGKTARDHEIALQVARETGQAEMKSAQSLLSHAFEAQTTLSRLDREQATLKLWSARAAALQAQEEATRQQREAATTAGAAADHVRTQLPQLQRTVDDARDAEVTAEATLDARRRDASELAAILSGLADRIRHGDTHCPVCASAFPEGELHTRARNALAVQDAQLADDVRALDVLRDRTKAAAQALAQAQSVISAAVAKATAAKAADATAASERAAIAEGLELKADSDLVSLIAERLTETDHARATHIRDVGGSATDVKSARDRVDTLSASLASLDERLASAVQRRTRYETALRAIEDSLGGYPKPWNTEAAGAALDVGRKRVEDARAGLRVLMLKRAETTNAEAAARERLAAAEAECERLALNIRDAEAAHAASVDRWREAGLKGEPSSQAIEAQEAAWSDRARVLAAHLEEAIALSRRFEAFLAQGELRALRALMEKQGGEKAADNPVPRAQQLQQELQAARTALQLTTATRDAVVAYGDQLKAEAESFSTQFLLPLNDLIDGFNRVLLSTPGESVQFNAEHTVERTALAMQLRYTDVLDNAQYKTTLPPQLVLSEGQMAANGFSILCAASTAYRWSRWRALLLDDPLQHNDIIHAAAFVDVMRNLVELEGYQLIMSSHKRDEGEFIARKFDAAGLPCTVVELVGASKNGVRVARPRHNAAARLLLAEPEARLA